MQATGKVLPYLVIPSLNLVKGAKDGQTVGGTSIMGLMMLAASPGCFITVSVTGSDAGDAMAAIAELVESGFGEED